MAPASKRRRGGGEPAKPSKLKQKGEVEPATVAEENQEPEQVQVKEVKRPVVMKGSRLFEPFRAVGLVSTGVPFALQSRGGAYFVTTCTGSGFQIFDCAHLGLLFVGPPAPAQITALENSGDLTFAACGQQVVVYDRARESWRFTGPTADIFKLLIFGGRLLSLDRSNELFVWDIAERSHAATIELGAGFGATCMLHPSTYLNKVLVANSSGVMQLWNIRTGSLVHEFTPFPYGVTALAQSPVLDVVAVGLSDGTIVLFNLKFDQALFSVQQQGVVTSLAFRTDDVPVIASGNHQGDICVWDLSERRLVHFMQGSHDASVAGLSFLHGQPILISNAGDNAVKEWIFDAPDGHGRLLRSRGGHGRSPEFARFYGTPSHEFNHYIISAGRDHTLRLFSVIRDAQATEFSQGSIEAKARHNARLMERLRLPVVTQFASCETQERYWDNVLTAHGDHSTAYTWTTQRRALGKHKLATQDGSAVKSVAISACGNFGVLGCASGAVDVFNMQSGLHRRHLTGHTKAVTGVATDAINRRLVSCSLDGTVRVREFNDAAAAAVVFEVGSPATRLELHRDSDLCAVAADDLVVRLYDIETGRLVRRFAHQTHRVTDLAFSPDGRWLLAASADGRLRCYDIPSAHLVDVLVLPSVPTSVSFSPKGDYIATTHVGELGVFLWANRHLYTNAPVLPVTDEEAEAAAVAQLPSSAIDDEDKDGKDGAESFFEKHPAGDASEKETNLGALQKDEPLGAHLITLSGLPKTRWQNLLHLEAIKERNKPIEAPKAPPKGVFF